MIMLRILSNLKNDADLWVKTFRLERGEVRVSVEDEAIRTSRERFLEQEEWLHATFIIRPGVRESLPRLVVILTFKINRDTICRLAARCVQNVC